MNFFVQTKRNYAHVLWFFLILLSISCNSVAQPETGIVEISPPPASEQPVEYGASLSEWEEATQPETNATDERTTQADVNTTNESAQQADTAATDERTAQADTVATEASTEFTLNDTVYQEIMWSGLVPADYTPDAIMAKYADQLAKITDGSPEASDLYAIMQEEFNNAPANDALNETYVRIPGFIAPLEYTEDRITKFLLVPYFGACIHVPPPPANQTVLVEADEGYGIKPEKSYNPIWVMGKLTVEGATTRLAQAGYFIQDAIIEPYNVTK